MSNVFQPRAVFSLTINGVDKTDTVASRLIDLSHTDNRGLEADTLEITLDDHDDVLELPDNGAKIRFSLGWAHSGLVDKGEFTVGKVSHSGTPDVLHISASSVDLRNKIRELKEKSFHEKTVGEIITSIAEQNKLTPVISQFLDAQKIAHIDQSNESDTNFISRLAEQFDAIATVKANRLLFILRGEAVTATGEPLPEQIITRQSGDQHNFSMDDSENYNGVKACWHNRDTGKKGEIIVDKNSVFEYVNRITKTGKVSKKKTITIKQPIAASSDKLKVLRHTYASETNAIRGAQAAWNKTKRGVARFSLTLACGNPELFPEVPVQVQGFKQKINEIAWLVTKVNNRLDADGGYTSSVEFEMRMDTEKD